MLTSITVMVVMEMGNEMAEEMVEEMVDETMDEDEGLGALI